MSTIATRAQAMTGSDIMGKIIAAAGSEEQGDLIRAAVDESVAKLAALSVENPDGITPELLRAAIGQAAVDKLAGQMAQAASIAGLDWNDLVSRFIGRYQSKHTQGQYRRNIAKWSGYCQSQGINPLTATGDHADGYTGWLLAQGISSNTINARINAASSLYAHLVKRGHIQRTPFTAVRRPRVEYTSKTVPPAAAMLAAIDRWNRRDWLAVAIMLDTGCRVGALETMRVNIKAQTWTATSKGKQHGGKFTSMAKAKAAARAIEGGLFTGHRNSIVVAITRAFTKAGIPGGAHQCRHRYAIDLYQASGKDIEAVRRAMGHGNVAITTAYLQGLQE